MSQNVGNSHNPFVNHLNLTTTTPPKKKVPYLIKTSPNILYIGPGGPNFQFSPTQRKISRLSRVSGPDLLPSSMRSSPCAPKSFNHDLSDRGKHPDDVQALNSFLSWQKKTWQICAEWFRFLIKMTVRSFSSSDIVDICPNSSLKKSPGDSDVKMLKNFKSSKQWQD